MKAVSLSATSVPQGVDSGVSRADVGRYTASFGVSFAVTSLLSALLVVVKESNEETVLAWMKAATGHHWVTHGLLDLALFFLLGWALAKVPAVKSLTAGTVATLVAGSLVLSGLVIAGFYL